MMKTEPAFRLGTGEVDDMCYDMEGDSPGSTLNRLDIIRLLTSIAKQCCQISICKNIEKLKKMSQSVLPSSSFSNNQPNRNNNHAYFPNINIDNHSHWNINNPHPTEEVPTRQNPHT